MLKKVCGLLFFTFCVASSAYASEVSTIPTDEQRKIEQIVVESEIEARNETYEELEGVYPTYLGDIEDTKKFKESVNKKLDKKIAKHGIKRESENTIESDEPASYSLASSSSPPTEAIDLRAPVVYSSSQGYFVKSSVYWKKKSNNVTWYWYDHAPLGYGTVDVGGSDGLGIYFSNSTNLNVSKASFYTYDENGASYNTNLYAYRLNSAGAYYKAQDTIENSTFNPYHNYSWTSSHISVWPNFLGKASAIARTQWTHTWSFGEISGASISNTGINVDISNVENSWDGTSSGYANIGN
jgi:hypothetical protein